MKQTPLTRRRFALLATGTALTGMAGCSTSGAEESTPNDRDESPTPAPTPSPTDAPATTDTETPDASDDAAVVAMITDNEGMYFDPKGLVVEPGTTVRFVNESGSHGTNAYHPENEEQPLRIPDEAEPWESEIFAESDQHFEITLDVEGVYDYYCPPHESMGMVGRIVVGEPQEGPATSPPEELPPGAREALPSIEEIVEHRTVAGP